MGPHHLAAAVVSAGIALADPGGGSWLDGFAWQHVGPPEITDVVDVAGAGDRAALVTAEGDVWLSVDRAATWRLVRRGGAADRGGFTEEALLDVEVRVAEVLDSVVDPDLADADAYEDPDLAAAAVAAATDRVRAEHLDDGFAPVSGREATGGVARVEVEADAILLATPEGAWSSDVDGRTWRRLSPVAASAIVRGPDGALLVGGPDGVRRVDDDDLSVLPPVRDLVVGRAGLRAATADGIWASADGSTWAALAGVLHDWRRVAVDGDVLWAADAATVRAGAPPDVALAPPLGPPPSDPRDLLVEPGGVVVVAARDGAWVSRDGGESYAPLGQGLDGAEGRAVAVVGRTLLLATDRGLFALVAQVAETVAEDDVAFPPTDVLCDAAARSIPSPATPRRASPSWLIPQLSVQAAWGQRTAVYGGTRSTSPADVVVSAALSWQPPGAGSGSAAPTSILAWQDDAGGVQVYSGAFDAWMLLAREGRRLADARLRAVGRVGELTARHAALLAERGRGGVGEQVETALRIAELEAWIDALTDGALARWRVARAEEAAP